jgi:hypothetical protein
MSVRITNNVVPHPFQFLGKDEVCKLLRASLVKYFFALRSLPRLHPNFDEAPAPRISSKMSPTSG